MARAIIHNPDGALNAILLKQAPPSHRVTNWWIIITTVVEVAPRAPTFVWSLGNIFDVFS